MSEPVPHVAAQAHSRARWSAALTVAAALFACSNGACDSGESLSAADGSFGRGVTDYPRDSGIDAGINLDAGAVSGSLPSVRVRFVHAVVNLGPLRVCHDPDGPGPAAAAPIASDAGALWANFRERSTEVTLAPLSAGALTLQRAPRTDGGGSAADGGVDPCAPSEREATIPLPQNGNWLNPRDPVDDATLEALEASRTLSGAPSLTLVGTGFAIDPASLAQRAAAARAEALADEPDDLAGAEAAGELERHALEAAFGPRLTIQRDTPSASSPTFSLSVLHAIPDVASSSDDPNSSAVGAVRLCVTAGARESNALPRPPLPGIPFRYRTTVGAGFEPGRAYHFRVFAQRDFDAANRDCSTIGSSPIVERRFPAESLLAGRAYTLALIGALAPGALCSPGETSLVRPGCVQGANELAAKIELLED